MTDPSRLIRVATWNIHRTIGADGRADPERIIAVLRELSPDVIALQEVAYRSVDVDDVLLAFSRAIKAEPIEGITLLDERGHYGNAVLTRLPVRSLQRHDISFVGREPRGAIELVLDCNARNLRIIATHLGLRPAERRHQIQQLLPLFETETSELDILLGDLNEWFLLGRPLRMLHDVFGPVAAPATFPARLPLLALDRIWTRPPSSVQRIVVHKSPLARQASDHLPLVADLALP